jgi:transposase
MENIDIAAENAALKAENASLRAAVQHLKVQMRALLDAVHGIKSERFLTALQPETLPPLPLFAETEAPPVPEPPTQTLTRKVPVRKPVQSLLGPSLPRKEIVIEPSPIPEGMVKIGQEVTETLDYVPARLCVVAYIRPKYADPKREERGVVIAPMPERPIPKAMAEAGLIAHVAVEKYIDHMPLYRQAKRFEREGVNVSESSLGAWVGEASDLLAPLDDRLRALTLESGYVQADETTISVQDRTLKGKTHQGYFWLFHAPESGLVSVMYNPHKNAKALAPVLKGYRGALQSDRYAVYLPYDTLPEVTGYACWAHARRHFFDARVAYREGAEEALRYIQGLYAVERESREAGEGCDARRERRARSSKPQLDRLKKWLEVQHGVDVPKGPWTKALRYAREHWTALARYAETGHVEIDNNLIENAVRPIALGRKNFMFAGNHEAAARAARFYGLFATCKKQGVEPFAWLRDVLQRIKTHPPDLLDALLPHRWALGQD